VLYEPRHRFAERTPFIVIVRVSHPALYLSMRWLPAAPWIARGRD
jgi:hypothetical protein